MSHAALHAIVQGRVQGVFFRAGTAREADRLGLGGWVKNLPDGRVEVDAVGGEESLREFHRWLQHGPPAARVDHVDASWETRDARPAGFSIAD